MNKKINQNKWIKWGHTNKWKMQLYYFKEYITICAYTIAMSRDHSDDRPPEETTLMRALLHEKHPDERPPWHENHPDKRPPWQETTLTSDQRIYNNLCIHHSDVRDHSDDRPPEETTLMRDHSYMRSTLMRDHPDMRTTLTRDHPDERHPVFQCHQSEV